MPQRYCRARLRSSGLLGGIKTLAFGDRYRRGDSEYCSNEIRREIWKVIRQLAANGVTILITSHVLHEAENCDQIILLRNGKILATGTPQALKSASKKEAMEEVFISLVEKR